MVKKERKEFTLIEVRKSTREKLKAIGDMGESYDRLINRLIDAGKQRGF